MDIYVGGGLSRLKLVPGQNTYQELFPARYPNANRMYDSIYIKFINFSRGRIPSDELFSDQIEIRFALLLSSDGLLPEAIQKRLSILTIQGMDEATSKKYTLETLKICAPPSGRKLDVAKKYKIYIEIQQLRSSGLGLDDSLNQVAEKYDLTSEAIASHYKSIQAKIKSSAKKDNWR